MGLDMYLTKRTYVKNWSFMDKPELHEVTVKKAGKVRKDIDKKKISSIVEEVAYWRKANQIHRWFVENVQEGVDDCREYYVSFEQLEKLVTICETVLAAKNDTLSASLLPPQQGFFFGSYEFDDWYYENVSNTIDQLKECIINGTVDNGSKDYYYSSSW
jgi:negative regulator of genetic competence, sporulation and motility